MRVIKWVKKNARVKLKKLLGAMDAAARQPLKSNEEDLDTSSSASGKRDRSTAERTWRCEANPTSRAEGKCPRGDVQATTSAAYLAVVHTHAQWWSPDLKPKIAANKPSVVEGVDGAISAWVTDECNRTLGQE